MNDSDCVLAAMYFQPLANREKENEISSMLYLSTEVVNTRKNHEVKNLL